MKKIVALDYKKHKKLGWMKPDNYMFTSKSTSVALTTYELRKAMMVYPIAFLKSDKTFTPIAILGIKRDQNLFVDDKGQWLFGYIPVLFRTYPIILIPQSDGKSGIGFIDDSDLIGDDKDMIPFFSKDGDISIELNEIVDTGQISYSSRFDSFKISEALAKYELYEKWPLSAKLNDKNVDVSGLWRINQKALKNLNGEVLYELNKMNALTVIYSQLLSMQNLQLFQKLITYRNVRKNRNLKLQEKIKDQSIDLSFLNDGDSINFDNLD